MRLNRYWMTGCMALVLLAAGRWPDLRDRTGAGSADDKSWVAMTSKYPVDETVSKLEKAARSRGLHVVAKVAPAAPAGEGSAATVTVLVLGDPAGQTPVVQAADDAPPDLPMKVVVLRLPDGATKVLFADGQALVQALGDAPPEVVGKVRLLPKLVKSVVT